MNQIYDEQSAQIAAAFKAAGFPQGSGFLHRLESQIIKAGPLMPPVLRLSKSGKDVQIKSYNRSFFSCPVNLYSPRQWLKFAFLMGYDTAALEEAIGPITAHEKIEWSCDL